MDLISEIVARAKANPQRIVLPEGTEERTLTAADRVLAEGVAELIIIGNPAEIKALAEKLGLKYPVPFHHLSLDSLKHLDVLLVARGPKLNTVLVAVLPSRLKKELTDLAQAIVDGKDIASDEVLSKHAPWVEELKKQYTFTQDNAMDILMQETGKVFAAVLEDAGVYKNTDQGRAAFMAFVDAVNQK